jgi:outer membrane protein assembly factor BamB
VSTDLADTSASRKPLRLWPGIAAAVLLVLYTLLLPFAGGVGGGPPALFLGGLAGGVLIILWWLLFSRARWIDRLAVPTLMIAAVLATRPFIHESMASGGQGVLFFILSVPVMALALVAAAAAASRLSERARRASIAAAILAAGGGFALVSIDGISGEGAPDFRWRWAPTDEERMLSRDESPPPPPAMAAQPLTPPPSSTLQSAPALPPAETSVQTSAPPKTTPAPDAESQMADWPGFRGPNRDSTIRNIHIATDWATSPPAELWRKPIGPGWSSFAVGGDRIYTQEQRGEDEVVSCYRLSTGALIWRHRDAVRFYETIGGPGPRATPTIHRGRIYTHGATGIVNALDAATGARIWTRNSVTDTGAADPGWGFTSSPLVFKETVVLAASGVLIAYDIASGEPRWRGPDGGAGYSSPHLVTLDDVPQILLLRGSRTTSVKPADGAVLWEHRWQPSASIVQPAVIGPRDLLINISDTMGGQGMRRLAISRQSDGPTTGSQPSGVTSKDGWTVEERWTSRGLKPYYNDFVIHNGHAYGFDGSILSSIDLETGERKWKGGRYGFGQMLLLADQNVLLVLSEDGELALVRAAPDTFTEIARFKAIEGKTWNHPVLVGDVLLIRNGQEMAAFRLTRTGGTN